ncbi:unnamed protein product [Porites evermanni]|uniref:Lipocalin/cytosolic fatty-acid binding domain-containing protein n=1 Tax=Porites evermanni TaxID=104178 RepID=A0ABN8M8A0_9CNID|nr:unnamed protein product [Porites evermanni]
MAGYQGDEPSNEFIEFVQVWNRREPYPEAIILFESSSGEFVVQVGYKIDEERTHNARILTLVTSAGSVVEIKRKKKVEQEGILPSGNVLAGNGNIRQFTMESSHETQGAEVKTTPDGWKGHLKTMISLDCSEDGMRTIWITL